MIRSRIKLPQTQALFLYTTSEKTVKNGFIEGIMKKRQTRLVNLSKFCKVVVYWRPLL